MHKIYQLILIHFFICISRKKKVEPRSPYHEDTIINEKSIGGNETVISSLLILLISIHVYLVLKCSEDVLNFVKIGKKCKNRFSSQRMSKKEH